jgi:endo-beta-N-acetylglucosaminidase D
MIDSVTGEPLPHLNFWNGQLENLRQSAMNGDSQSLEKYQSVINDAIEQLPCVYHYSWLNIERKIRLYRDYWQNHWNALFNLDTSDTAENNMFFSVPWSEVTDEMIKTRAAELSTGTTGWVFHRKWSGQQLPRISVKLKG